MPSEPLQLTLFVSPDGTIRFVHDDDVAAALAVLGEAVTVRAGHVEPVAGGWEATLADDFGGAFVGRFRRRDDALAAERVAVEDGLRRLPPLPPESEVRPCPTFTAD